MLHKSESEQEDSGLEEQPLQTPWCKEKRAGGNWKERDMKEVRGKQNSSIAQIKLHVKGSVYPNDSKDPRSGLYFSRCLTLERSDCLAAL